MKTITPARIAAACRKVKNLRNATRIWNLIDRCDEPEPLWAAMTAEIPWAFRDASKPSSMKFVYRSPKFDADFTDYAKTRSRVVRSIAMLRGHLAQIAAIVSKYPKTNEEAGYVDLDNIEELDNNVTEGVQLLCTGYCFEFVEWENSRLAIG